MTVDSICREVKRLKRKFHETDPFMLCKAMGILLLYAPMGTYAGACKGFFLAQSRKRSITVNCDLPGAIQRIIVTHELGHAVLHAKAVGVKAFHDFGLFDSTSSMEYEANIFAAEFLLDDRDVLEKLNEDVSIFGAASLLRVPPELLDFKLRLMKRNGYKIDPPLMANSNFLKDMGNPADEAFGV